MKTRAAEERIFFDDGDFESQLARTNPGDVSARPAADDHDVILLICQRVLRKPNCGADYTYFRSHETPAADRRIRAATRRPSRCRRRRRFQGKHLLYRSPADLASRAQR